MLIIDEKRVSPDLKKKQDVNIAICQTISGKIRVPKVTIAGHDPASELYVSNKAKTCKEIGFISTVIVMSADTINQLNNNSAVQGVLGGYNYRNQRQRSFSRCFRHDNDARKSRPHDHCQTSEKRALSFQRSNGL
jgi:hypothetical protein